MILVFAPPAFGEARCERQDVRLEHPTANARHAELSGAVLLKDRLVTISNEGLDEEKRQHYLQIFKGDTADGFTYEREILLYEAHPGACAEADFEALAIRDDAIFAVTSHSANREKQKPSLSRDKNRDRLSRDGIEACDARHQLRKFRIAGDAKEELAQTSLRDFITGNRFLEPFSDLPNKENGIDIEGMAATRDWLYVGFRGPVLRQNYVPVLRMELDIERPSGDKAKLLFVNLEGRGVRDMTALPDGNIIILAGPNGDEDQSFAVYLWDGKDQVGEREAPPRPQKLCDLGLFPLNPDDKYKDKGFHKPEAIVQTGSTNNTMEFLLLHDGPLPLKADLLTIED